MRKDYVPLAAVVAVAMAAVVLLAVVDVADGVLAAISALLVATIGAFSSLFTFRLESERARKEKAEAEQKEHKAHRDEARQAGIPLQAQLRDAATKLEGGYWPDPAAIEIELAREDRKALVDRLGKHYVVVQQGQQALRSVEERARKATSSRIDNEVDRLVAEMFVHKLTLAASALDEATWSELEVEEQERKQQDLVDELANVIKSRLGAS